MNKRMSGLNSEDREWQAQERAVHDERDGVAVGDDPLQQRHRLVARALRQPPPDALPTDFAARVALIAARTAHAPPDLRVEQQLVRVLLVLLALSAAVVCAAYGGRWLQAIAVLLPGVAGSWALALMACIAASWAFDLLRKDSDTRA